MFAGWVTNDKSLCEVILPGTEKSREEARSTVARLRQMATRLSVITGGLFSAYYIQSFPSISLSLSHHCLLHLKCHDKTCNQIPVTANDSMYDTLQKDCFTSEMVQQLHKRNRKNKKNKGKNYLRNSEWDINSGYNFYKSKQ